MKKFTKHIFRFLVIFLVASVIIDLVYTSILSSSTKRNKVENIIHSKNEKFDVIFMGTSRANNHFVTEIFEKKGFKSFNFGMSGSHMFETCLLLKIMKQNNFKIKNLILEADLSVCNDKRDEGTTARFMPYLHKNSIIKNHYSTEPDFIFLYYFPFYRYIKFDNKIGLREIKNVIKKETTNSLDNKGYYPLLKTKSGKMKNDISTLKPIRNKYLDEIKKICKEENINLILVTTPMCSNTKGIEYFEKIRTIYPEIHNFENVVNDDKYFSSCGHMNKDGAVLYTKFILNYFENKLK